MNINNSKIDCICIYLIISPKAEQNCNALQPDKLCGRVHSCITQRYSYSCYWINFESNPFDQLCRFKCSTGVYFWCAVSIFSCAFLHYPLVLIIVVPSSWITLSPSFVQHNPICGHNRKRIEQALENCADHQLIVTSLICLGAGAMSTWDPSFGV